MTRRIAALAASLLLFAAPVVVVISPAAAQTAYEVDSPYDAAWTVTAVTGI